MAQVVLDQLTKIYPNGVAGVSELSLDIDDGEFLVLVGPSGCGKSTALRMVAGLESITGGTLTIGDRVVNDLPPKDRDIAMVFQNYALYPHMTVAENIGFALKLAGRPKAEIRHRVEQAARTLQLEEWLERKPGQLSGGQRQRVAMGRAIVREPAVFLMDEPLSNLDAKLRVQMRSEIARLQRDLKTTTIYVTHDQVEAMTMGDRVAVMRTGRLLQVAPPEELYDHPDDLFVAAFIGSPAMNLLEVTLEPAESGGGDGVEIVLAGARIGVPSATSSARPALRSYVGRDLILGIRPDALADGSLGPTAGGCTLRGELELREALGSEIQAHVRIAARPAMTDEIRHAASDVDDAAVSARERDAREGSTLVVARFDPRSRARVGDRVELGIDIDRLHFFDPETGRAIRD